MTNTRSHRKEKTVSAHKVSVVAPVTKKRRVGGRSQRVRATVFNAAIDVLISNGYEDFRITDVASRASVNATSIYRRWGTKETLLIEALLNRAEADLAIPNTGSLRSDLIAFLHELISFLQSPFGTALVQVGAISMNRPELFDYRLKYWTSRLSRVQLIFERAVARREIPANVDIALLLEFLAGPLYARMLFASQPLDQELAEKIVDIVLSGISRNL